MHGDGILAETINRSSRTIDHRDKWNIMKIEVPPEIKSEDQPSYPCSKIISFLIEEAGGPTVFNAPHDANLWEFDNRLEKLIAAT